MRRLLSVALSLALALSCLPFGVFAADDARVKLILDPGVDNLINFDIHPWAEAGRYVLFLTPEVPEGCTVRYYRNGVALSDDSIKLGFVPGSDALKVLLGPNKFTAAAVDASGNVVAGSQSLPISIYGEDFAFYSSSFVEGIQKFVDDDMVIKARYATGHEKELVRALIDYDEAAGTGRRKEVAQSKRQNIGYNTYARRLKFTTRSGNMNTEFFIDGQLEKEQIRLIVCLCKFPADTVVGDPLIVHLNKDNSLDVQGIPTRAVVPANTWNHVQVTFNHSTSAVDMYVNDVLVAKNILFHCDMTNLGYFCVHGLGIDKNIYYDNYGAGYSLNKVDRDLMSDALSNADNMYGKSIITEFGENSTKISLNKEKLLKGFRTDLVFGALTKDGGFYRVDFDCDIHSTTPLHEEYVFEVADVERISVWRKSDMSLLTQIGNPKYYSK